MRELAGLLPELLRHGRRRRCSVCVVRRRRRRLGEKGFQAKTPSQPSMHDRTVDQLVLCRRTTGGSLIMEMNDLFVPAAKSWKYTGFGSSTMTLPPSTQVKSTLHPSPPCIHL